MSRPPPILSIIIPTLNCAATLELCLSAIGKSTFQDYEIILVDGQSNDRTQDIARHYAHRLLIPSTNRERGDARNHGIRAATGEILVFTDADNVMKPDTLSIIVDYFSRHPDVDAVNGLISKEHPHANFLSQYKNLYMHFIFQRLPETITFLHGSLYAVRRKAIAPADQETITDDTARGQDLFLKAKRIRLLKDLEVIHLKKYGLGGFLKNEFIIPYSWACLFLRYRGWQQLGRHGTGFAHASRGQLVSVILTPLVVLAALLAACQKLPVAAPALLLLVWFALNARFLVFLARERGPLFGLLSIPVTFLDGLVMWIGICAGLLRWAPVVRGKAKAA
jgi:glycosyltransferase involved in cell wall biosynthesis